MKFFFSLFVSAFAAFVLALATPTPTPTPTPLNLNVNLNVNVNSTLDNPRNANEISLCMPFAHWTVPSSLYELNNNLWGLDFATSGSQCTFLDSISVFSSSSSSPSSVAGEEEGGGGISWHTTWSWTGSREKVKSFVYSGRKVEKANKAEEGGGYRRKVSEIRGLNTKLAWNYRDDGPEGMGMRANVAFDLFTSQDGDAGTERGDYEVMVWWVLLFPLSQVVEFFSFVSRGYRREWIANTVYES